MTVRLNDSKDSDIIEVMKHIPESFRSEATRKALRKFFNLPEPKAEPLEDILSQLSSNSVKKQLSQPVPTSAPKEEKPTQTHIMKQPQREKVPEGNPNDFREKFRRRSSRQE